MREFVFKKFVVLGEVFYLIDFLLSYFFWY